MIVAATCSIQLVVWALARARFRGQQQGDFQQSGSGVRSLYLSTSKIPGNDVFHDASDILDQFDSRRRRRPSVQAVLGSLTPEHAARPGAPHTFRDRTREMLERRERRAGSTSREPPRRLLNLIMHIRAAQVPMAAAAPAPAAAPISCRL